ncbi:MAG: transcriptional regulator [Deltaproteobacteria bacterium]|nr:transcriptional regulator [Deltaproteobacteria bacterium]
MGIIRKKRSHQTRRKVASSGLADALFTTTQQRVLALLFGQPARSFYATELIELTGSGSGAVQRELKRLSSSGLLTITRIGNQKHYQANPDSPVYEELRGLVIKTVALVEPIRTALEPFADQITLALLYGSVVKRTDTANSDIDVLIVAEGLMLEDVYKALLPVEAVLDRKVSPSLYTPQEFADRKASNNAFVTNVLSGEHLVLMGNEHEHSTAR